jgi:beta-glucosidase
LSYTTFEYSDLVIGREQAAGGESVDISLAVRNDGKVAGEEVVQLYICDEFASITRPVKELKGYRRVLLAPGESKKITFHLPVDQLAFYDLDSNLILETGKIEILVGSSSEDIRMRGEFEIIGNAKMPVQHRIFVCPVTVE